jgi:DNA polymerase-3 subunit delta
MREETAGYRHAADGLELAMPRTIHALDYLDAAEAPRSGFIAVFGNERFLQLAVLQRMIAAAGDDDAEFATSRFDGRTAAWQEVNDALATGSLFSAAGQRTVVVEDADEFVKNHRPELERVAERIGQLANILVLVVGTWPSNTRLYKALDEHGLQIDCNLPMVARGKGKRSTKAASRTGWCSRLGQPTAFRSPRTRLGS